ncbi:hypothetical protein F9C07_776 [Aspergillus flavus]|uniref:Uncharacterized protein n=1 Tax=Aspergillus flavus (strain ATCC 200026 / FGSC A1120 / IAM 13836 / NRRL 3357 / JCM 12722 / SRRC 167) TaxID=332952 RepID=A0A7U2MQ60_ASPFN|nr:hypothetical protein F9C07_776 [Aspergillus flavus]
MKIEKTIILNPAAPTSTRVNETYFTIPRYDDSNSKSHVNIAHGIPKPRVEMGLVDHPHA